MRRLALLLLILGLAGTALAQTSLTIHYHRFDDTYAGWGLHLWGAVQEDGGAFIIDGNTYDWQNPMPPTGTDSWGVYWDVPISAPNAELGFIIHNGNNKDPGPDQHWSDYDTDIWILSGFTQIFTEEPNPDIRMMSAVSDGADHITLALARNASDLDAFHVFQDDIEQTATAHVTDPRTVILTLEQPIDITLPYTVVDDVGGNAVAVHHEFDDAAFEYTGSDLGYTRLTGNTRFKLWSPVAEAATVVLYDGPYPVEGELFDEYPMTRSVIDPGVLEVTVPGDQLGRYYLYRMTVYGETYLTPDLYSVALSSNSQRTQIIDLDATDPDGWDEDTYPTFDPIESIVYELHVRDVTASEFWNGSASGKNKFLGVVEGGTSYQGLPTGFDHIIDLGVNTVQILPMYDFSSVDENNADSRNWGYDPYSYNTPEGSYSTDPDDGMVRIREMKAMVKAFHDAGIKVVMDVVYNHTHNVGPQGSLYDAMVPKYYYRLLDDGSYSNGSGVGNEVATEALMARHFIKQSCRYWVEEFHIDGFRFDLMGLMDTDIMTEITADVKAINPHAIVYGEPWSGYGGTILTGKGDQRGLGFGCFNDNIRNAIRGSTDGTDPGYALTDLNDRAGVLRGLDGAINDFTDQPTETINYISAHDNYTWWDKADYRWNEHEVSPPGYSEDELIRMNQFGISMVLTAQGIPFLHAGSEFLRTKRTGDPGQDEEAIRNSYNQGDDVNALDWARRVQYEDVVDYYKGLVALRRARPEFRLSTKAEIDANQHFLTGLGGSAIAYTLDDVTPGDGWGEILVVHNPSSTSVSVPLPGGQWAVVVNADHAGIDPLHSYVSPESTPAQVDVPWRSTMVLYRETGPTLQLNVFQNTALDRHLLLAVNVFDGSNIIDVAVNGEEVAMASQAEGSWLGSYVMAASGDLTIQVSSRTEMLERLFTIWDLTGGTNAVSRDGRLECLVPRGAASGGWLVVADRSGRPDLPADTWAVGDDRVTLARPAVLRIRTADTDRVIQRRTDQDWETLPTRISNDGHIETDVTRLGVFRLAQAPSLPRSTRLLGNVPNPFNPRTAIRFELSTLDAGAPVTLRVYDLQGRFVRTLVSGRLDAGPQIATWDGHNTDGRLAPSGVYFYRLATRQQTLAGRMLMVK